MNRIETAVNGSPIWKQLNDKCKELYAQYDRTPTEEEYQALRTMLVCKVALDDPQVMKVFADCTFEVLKEV